MSEWHLVSTFETEQTLADFCASIQFQLDDDEPYIYQIKDAIARGKNIERKNWYRISTKGSDSGQIEQYTTDDGWSVVNTPDSDWKLSMFTSFWIFGTAGAESVSYYKDLKILKEIHRQIKSFEILLEMPTLIALSTPKVDDESVLAIISRLDYLLSLVRARENLTIERDQVTYMIIYFMIIQSLFRMDLVRENDLFYYNIINMNIFQLDLPLDNVKSFIDDNIV